MNHAVKNDNAKSLEDDFLDLCKDILLHLSLNDIMKNAVNDIKDATKNKNIKRCINSKKNDHEKLNYFFTHSEK